LYAHWDALSGWIAVALIGGITGSIAFAMDITEATISDLKFGHCSRNIILSKEACCRAEEVVGNETCSGWTAWGESYAPQFGVYLGWACLAGIVSSAITMLSKQTLPLAAPGVGDKDPINSMDTAILPDEVRNVKSLYMSAGAGVPEIKTILSGFVIPHFLGFKVLVLKATGAVFAVASGLPLGKEAPLIHIGACVGNLVGERFPKYSHNGKQIRDLITAGSAAGISAAFGAPIGGVLFAYEVMTCSVFSFGELTSNKELSVYFPRKALYRTFLCSMVAAITLRFFNPFGTGRLVLFETDYGASA
jgi:chloride channel 3/4/5